MPSWVGLGDRVRAVRPGHALQGLLVLVGYQDDESDDPGEDHHDWPHDAPAAVPDPDPEEHGDGEVDYGQGQQPLPKS